MGIAMNLTLITLTTILLLLILLTRRTSAQAKYDSCYSCRSRGEFGDCKDRFKRPPPFNASDPLATNKVQSEPCASGWCFKQLEEDDGGKATERGCMVRRPSDRKERCAMVVKDYKKVFMCFCAGDNCNMATSSLNLRWALGAFGVILCFLLG